MEHQGFDISVPVHIGGKQRRLIFDLNAMAQIENVTGLSVADPNLWGALSFKRLTQLLHAGLVQADKGLKETTVATWFDAHGVGVVSEAIGEAVRKHMSQSGEAAAPLQSETA